jgi:DNA-directed RNA polymerase specialized sigma24 family protein
VTTGTVKTLLARALKKIQSAAAGAPLDSSKLRQREWPHD